MLPPCFRCQLQAIVALSHAPPHAGTALAGILAVLLAGGLDMKATLAVSEEWSPIFGLRSNPCIVSCMLCATPAASGSDCVCHPCYRQHLSCPLRVCVDPSSRPSLVPHLHPQGKQHYLLYCLTPAMKPRMLMTGALGSRGSCMFVCPVHLPGASAQLRRASCTSPHLQDAWQGCTPACCAHRCLPAAHTPHACMPSAQPLHRAHAPRCILAGRGCLPKKGET